MWLPIEMFGPNISKLVLRLDTVDGDRVVLNQLLDEEISQCGVLCPGGVGAISGADVLSMKGRNTVELILES